MTGCRQGVRSGCRLERVSAGMRALPGNVKRVSGGRCDKTSEGGVVRNMHRKRAEGVARNGGCPRKDGDLQNRRRPRSLTGQSRQASKSATLATPVPPDRLKGSIIQTQTTGNWQKPWDDDIPTQVNPSSSEQRFSHGPTTNC